MNYKKYSEIYDDVFASNGNYLSAEFSPGYRTAIEHADSIRATGNRHLDVGCGVGFVVGLLGSGLFQKDSYGVDVSQVALDLAKKRGIQESRLKLLINNTLPFPDSFFDLVTCFDVIEHLDLEDIFQLSNEMNRIISPNGVLILNISIRTAGSVDKYGDNLHRTVKNSDFYADMFSLQRYTVSAIEKQISAVRHGKWKI